jgi:uncharacterized caspase-like protein
MRVLFLLAFILGCSLTNARASERVALVIGNGAYQHAAKLKNPANDASDIARALREIGFEVIEGHDLDRRGVEAQVRAFSDKLDTAKIALFFYAGHGLQVDGRNYLVPVDARLQRPGDVALDAVDVQVVLQQMEAGQRANLVFLDACRDNPLARSLASALGTGRSGAVGRGLTSMQSPVGTLIAFATQPDAIASDGSGRNSPFTAALVKHIRTPGIDIAVLMRRVRNDVLAATGRKQVPWDHSSLTDSVVLVAAPDETAAKQQQQAPTLPPAVALPQPAPQSAADEAARAWSVTKDTTSTAVLEAFVKRFSNTIYGEMARARLSELRASTKQAEAAKRAEKVAAAPPANAPATEKPAADTPSLCKKLLGTWSWFIGPDVTFRADGSATTSLFQASWTCRDSQVVMVWNHGFTDRLTISPDGNRLSGRNQVGTAVSGTRKF